jgi:hypothetical protein
VETYLLNKEITHHQKGFVKVLLLLLLHHISVLNFTYICISFHVSAALTVVSNGRTVSDLWSSHGWM